MKWFLLLIALSLVAGVLLSIETADTDNKLDIIEVNRIAMIIEEEWPAALSGQLPDSRIEFAFIPAGNSVNSYIANRDTLADIHAGGNLVGKIVVYNDSNRRISEMRARLTVIFYAMTALLAVSCGLFALHQHRTIMKPFQRMKEFASQVSRGDLSIPLEMDRENRFGEE